MAEENNKAIDSLDPRIARANLSGGNSSDMENLLHFQTYEVFHQKKINVCFGIFYNLQMKLTQ